MRQYLDAKQQHRDAIVFFRMGDFYEMFYEDALTAARALDLTLTSRSKNAGGSAIPMCGIPHHAADGYLTRLVQKGFRVAICEQVEDAKKAKGIVRREVVRVVSPGTFTEAGYLEDREPTFLMGLVAQRGVARDRGGSGTDLDRYGMALLDVSTGEFAATEYRGDTGRQALADDIAVLRPRECLVASDSEWHSLLPDAPAPAVTAVDPWLFDLERARHALTTQLDTAGLEGFGLSDRPGATAAAGALVHYLRETQKAQLAHVRSITFRETADAMVIDPPTLKHLEVVTSSEGTRAGSLLGEIDQTVTVMGSRLLRGWMLRPLVSLERVHDRLDGVEELAFRSVERGKLRELLKSVHDLERLVARAAMGTAGPRDLVALQRTLATVPRVRAILDPLQAPLTGSLLAELDEVPDIRDTVEATLGDAPPALARDGGAIRDGVDPELDELRGISRGGKEQIAAMEAAERSRTGIGSLKIRFNRVFGYYIEVSKANLHAVPDDYHRKQTIAGGERFITPVLKEYEQRVLGADERILEREIALFDALRDRVAAAAGRIQDSARALANLDVLAGLAETAAVHDYTKPHVHDGDELLITEGRHPVVERHVGHGFVPNDVTLNASSHQVIILTGPNMGGKSTYLRQVALSVLLAQIGSFVPANRAKIPITDRIFARVGASDNIARGQSTFMVEMQETANILHTATSRSLVLLDEIGRGTATYDGLSIAWAVAEHLATDARVRPKTLFATHYHELTDVADALAGVANYHVVAREWKDEIRFLRKVEPGRSDRSYGIQVARLAGLPARTVERAKQILAGLERDELSRGGRPTLTGADPDPQAQLALFAAPSETATAVARRLREVDLDQMTPLEALTLLADLKRDVAE
ncbi:MAG: DNA mismatch repair protein MutS [Acidobacteria bacterium]|jgi:DNA mismatch repair protein MutS|nr:DNA mismatch repair protein MutS [Acidobacteriota bacterium]MDP7339088.1 DNA mismatch repair protein MutS [Vicinamibacterales bacterium]HJN45271.1 DNA mismatch repair protein MutS [Vicinamibacterales bacterium]